MILAISLLWITTDCDSGSKKDESVLNSDYLRIHSISNVSDDSHRIAIDADDGQRWYLEKTPILDLTNCRLADTTYGCDPNGECYVVLTVEPHSVSRLSTWTRAHLGSKIGCLVGGKLVVVCDLHAQLISLIRISGFASEDVAIRVCDTIKRGGITEVP